MFAAEALGLKQMYATQNYYCSSAHLLRYWQGIRAT